MILHVIQDYLTGQKWEDLVIACCRSVYSKQDFTEVQAVYEGDCGIEGFTRDGIVIQCYCPEDRNLSNNDLYTNQRKKVTKDIKKLINLNNSIKLKAIGVPEIKKWIFIVPEYKDKRILEHLNKKKREVLKTKNSNPSNYTYISPDFDCLIKVADDYINEIINLFNASALKKKIDLPLLSTYNSDWDQVDSEKVENVSRKLISISPNLNSSTELLNKLIKNYMTLYVQGNQFMHKLGESFPDLRANISDLKNVYKLEVENKSILNPDHTLNNSIFNDLQREFTNNLEKEFSGLSPNSIMNITQSTTAEWLADCTLEFIGDANG